MRLNTAGPPCVLDSAFISAVSRALIRFTGVSVTVWVIADSGGLFHPVQDHVHQDGADHPALCAAPGYAQCWPAGPGRCRIGERALRITPMIRS
jgi:hypothetical protein